MNVFGAEKAILRKSIFALRQGEWLKFILDSKKLNMTQEQTEEPTGSTFFPGPPVLKIF
jgi:hypothetical protein